MVAKRLREFLDAKGVKYIATVHSAAFTAMEVAAAAHVPGRELAKTVMVWLDDRMVMAVMPSSFRVGLESLAAEAGARRATLATEDEFRERFPDCDTGAMPPFGNLWQVPVYVSEKLAGDERISFAAGTHNEIVTLAFRDFMRLAEPRVLRF